ncbi:hypothetical protein SCUCBS95973_005301 [Sporothrix curviconia]|uniref:UBC core domain-containing protein n=1 Tax=Sporothrix curviconia TaxID=1260050 RepID=A0ABP0BVR5_9PEZI
MQADAALGGAFDEPPASEDAEDNFAAYYRSIGKPTPIQVRISEDLRDIRQHGYYFGVLAGMSETSNENMLAVSIRTSDLGLAPEMLMAWDLDPDMFIVLLIRLRSRYMAYETLINAPKSSVDLSFRIRKCAHYKPSAEDARSSFGSKSDPDSTAKSRHADAGSQFAKILISTSLARFMDKYFLSLARYQGDYGCSWADAVNDVVNRTMASTSSNNQDNQRDRTGISPCRGSRQMSFPLLAMQFAMDQLKNCTEYCQACHARLDKSHRSLKPTVCSRDLCLYQHILLGVGRSVEYEILCQPNVVDLLINFCYTALRASNSAATDPIRSYPTNLPLKIPDFRKPLKVYLDHFENGYTAVLDATADIFLYTRDFDDLVETQKAAHLLMVLESLPPVQHLKTELEKPTVNDLKSASGISPAAAVLLNWIMATNRSPDFNTSLTYATGLDIQWPKSVFDLRSVVSLYEIINAPAKFLNQLPGSTAAAAIAINLDSDGDSGTSQANPGIAAASSRKATTVSLSPRPMRKISPGSKPPNAAADSSRSGQCADPGLTPFEPDKLDYASLPNLPVPSWCTSQAQRALAREIDRMQKVQANTPLPELGWYIDFSRLDNMFQWIVELHSFDMSLPLAKDMISFGVASIVCELRFGADYPFSPPLVRVIRPRFLPFLQGGGGNVTAGGAMCMEALTNTGWTPANQTDAVLLQVRLALCATDRPARLDRNLSKHDYGAEEAFAAYNRAAVTHGWTVPPDMQKRMKF